MGEMGRDEGTWVLKNVTRCNRQLRLAMAANLRIFPALPSALVVRFQHSHTLSAGTFANVGIKGPPENIDSSGALDLTFAQESPASGLANVKSAPLVTTQAR